MNLPDKEKIQASFLSQSPAEDARLHAMRDQLLATLPSDPPYRIHTFPLRWLKNHKAYTALAAACWILGFLLNFDASTHQTYGNQIRPKIQITEAPNIPLNHTHHLKLLNHILSVHAESKKRPREDALEIPTPIDPSASHPSQAIKGTPRLFAQSSASRRAFAYEDHCIHRVS